VERSRVDRAFRTELSLLFRRRRRPHDGVVDNGDASTMTDPKSPRASMQERLQRSRRHRSWARDHVDGASVGGDSSIASVASMTSTESSDKNGGTAVTATTAILSPGGTPATAAQAQLKTYRLAKIKQKMPVSRHQATGTPTGNPTAAPDITTPGVSDNSAAHPSDSHHDGPESASTKQSESSSASFRRRRVSQINVKTKKAPEATATATAADKSSPRNWPGAADPVPQPVDTQHAEKDFSSSKGGKLQATSPCEYMLYQASAMEEVVSEDDPVSSEGHPSGSRVQRLQRDGPKIRHGSWAQERSKNRNLSQHKQADRDDESVSLSTSASSTTNDLKSRQRNVESGGPSRSGAEGTPEVPMHIPTQILSGRVKKLKPMVEPPDVQAKAPSPSNGSHLPTPYHHPLPGRQPQQHLPSRLSSNNCQSRKVPEPPTSHLRQYGTTHLARSKEFGPPEVQVRTSPQTHGSHHLSPGHHVHRPSARPSNGSQALGVSEPTSRNPWQYGAANMVSSQELNSQKQPQNGVKVVPIRAPVTSTRTYNGRNMPAKESLSHQVPSVGGKHGSVPVILPTRAHPADSGGQPYMNYSKPRRQVDTETINSDKPDYSASIERPESASVSVLRASFDSHKNQPLMPMNSTDPRVRHSLPITNTKKYVPAQVKQQSHEAVASSSPRPVVAQRQSASGESTRIASYRPTESDSSSLPYISAYESPGRPFVPNNSAEQQHQVAMFAVGPGPAVSRSTHAGAERDGMAGSYRSVSTTQPIRPTATLESFDATVELSNKSCPTPNNEATAVRHSTNAWTNRRMDPEHMNDPAPRHQSHNVPQDFSAPDHTKDVESKGQQKSGVASRTQESEEHPTGHDEARKLRQKPSMTSPQQGFILAEQTIARSEVLHSHAALQTNKIRQYYKGSWRIEHEDDGGGEVIDSTRSEERSKPDLPVAASPPTVTRGSVAATWQQRIQVQTKPKDSPGPPNTIVSEPTPNDHADTAHTDRVSSHQSMVPPWHQDMLRSGNSNDSSSSNNAEKKEDESPRSTGCALPSLLPVITSQETNQQSTQDNQTKPMPVIDPYPTDHTVASHGRSSVLPIQQQAISLQQSKDSASNDDPPLERSLDHRTYENSPSASYKSNFETKPSQASDQQDDPTLQQPALDSRNEVSQHEDVNHSRVIDDMAPLSSSPMKDEFRFDKSNQGTFVGPTATSKPWTKDTRHSVLQSWQTRSLKSRDKEIEPKSYSVQHGKDAPDPKESKVPTFDDDYCVEEKKSGDLSVDEDRILGDTDDYLGHSSDRAYSSSPSGLFDSLKGSSKRLSYDVGVDSYVSAEISVQEDELAVQPSGSINVASIRSLKNLSSEEISVYVEDVRTKADRVDQIRKEDVEISNNKVDSQSNQPHEDEAGPKDLAGPGTGRRFPRLSPSPKDNDKYRSSYFGDESPAAHRAMNRKKQDGSDITPLAQRSSNGVDASQAMNFWASSPVSQEVQQEAINFKETDRWLDQDPDFADNASLSSDLNQENPPATTQKLLSGHAQDPAGSGFDAHVSSVIQESNTWTPADNLDMTSRPAKDKHDVFDPFSPEIDELKVEVSSELFSPNPDPFMTEESFSPVEWSTPRGATNAQHIGYYNSPDSRVEI
jgi:hypothetical protein